MDADIGSASMKMFGSLILVLGLIICLFYFLKGLWLRSSTSNNYPEMRIMGTLTLAPKKAIALIEICDQWLIVGIGAESVTLISKMDRPPEANDSDSVSANRGQKFNALLQEKGLWRQWKRIAAKRKDANS